MSTWLWMTLLLWRGIGNIDGNNIDVSFADSFCSSKLCHPIVSPLVAWIQKQVIICAAYSGYSPWLENTSCASLHYHHSSLLTLLSPAECPSINTQQSEWVTHSPVGHWLFSLRRLTQQWSIWIVALAYISQSPVKDLTSTTWSVPIPSTPTSSLPVSSTAMSYTTSAPLISTIRWTNCKGVCRSIKEQYRTSQSRLSLFSHKDSTEILNCYDHLKARR